MTLSEGRERGSFKFWFIFYFSLKYIVFSKESKTCKIYILFSRHTGEVGPGTQDPQVGP